MVGAWLAGCVAMWLRLLAGLACAGALHTPAQALDLPLRPAHRPGVLRYFALAAEMADLINQFPLTVQDEPAPSFVPISPADDAQGHNR